jgi:hypothetical protein
LKIAFECKNSFGIFALISGGKKLQTLRNSPQTPLPQRLQKTAAGGGEKIRLKSKLIIPQKGRLKKSKLFFEI